MDKDLVADVTLDNNNNQFEFAEISNEVHDQPSKNLKFKNFFCLFSNYFFYKFN